MSKPAIKSPGTMSSTAPSSVMRSAATADGTPRRASQPCTGANSTARTGIPMIPVAYGPRDHTSATPNAKTMNAARSCVVSRTAISLAATSLHANYARQRLPVNRDRDEIVAGRDLIRRATESAKASTTGGRPAESLRDKPQGSEASPPPAAAAALSGLAQQRAERREEARVGWRIARFATALTPGGQRSCRTRRARRCLAGPLHEPAVHEGRSTAASTTTSTAPPSTGTAEPEPLRDPLHVTGQQERLDRFELLRIAAVLRAGTEDDADALHEPGTMRPPRTRARHRRGVAALGTPGDAMQAGARWPLHRADRVATHVTNHDRRAPAPIAAPARQAMHDLGAILRTRRAKRLLAGATAAERLLAVLVRDRRLEQIGAPPGGDRAVIQLLERRDVHD